DDTSLTDARTFADTPFWTNLNGGQGAQATRTNILFEGTRNTVVAQANSSPYFGNETDHVLKTGDVLTVSFVWRDASNWNDAADRMAVYIFTTADGTISGPQTILGTQLTPLSTANNTWETFTTDFAPIPASADGKLLFVAFRAENGDGTTGFGRVDNFRLSANGDDPGLPPDPLEPRTASLIAEAYVDSAGSPEVIASRSFTLTSDRSTGWRHYHLAIPAGSVDAFAGREIGVRFRAPGGGESLSRYVDNIRLDHYPADAPDGSFSDDWNNSPDRVWPGPGYWGNRLHDWEVRNNRVNCILPNKPRRTLHRVGTSIRGNGGDFSLSVRTGRNTGTLGSAAKTGFLIGAGPNLDWRASLLVHDGLGRDFGTFLGIDHNGAAVIDDLSAGGINQVAIGGNPGGFPTEARLELSANYIPSTGEYDVTIESFSPADVLLSSASVSVPSDRVLGSFGLLSNRSNSGTTFWFDDFSGSGTALEPEPDHHLAIIGALHTLHRGKLRISAHLPPVTLGSTPPITLETWDGGAWAQIGTATIDNTDNLSSYTATFEIDDWDDRNDTPYRLGVVVDGSPYYWQGTVRKDPVDKNEIVVANTSCQRIADGNVESDDSDWSPTKIWHPHLLAFNHIGKHEPDVLLALGDQIYEGQPTPENSDTDFNRQHDYLYKWYLWLLETRDLAKDIPTISIPDDHDVFQGNLWGEGGIATSSQNTGGYEEPASWVRLVDRTQTSHMPAADPYNPTQPAPPVAQGIGVYFTGVTYGEIGFAVLEDRKFKTGRENFPADPNQQFLLGQRQKDFLRAWATDWVGEKVKCVVSQSPFGMIHTHAAAGYNFGLNDRDTHGWPTHRREEAWELLRLSRSFQLAGDQHIGTLVHHGIEAPADAGYSFTSPAISNFFPRCWDPDHNAGGRTETISDYKGDFFLNGVGTLPSGRPNLNSQIPGHIRVIGAANPLEYYNRTRNIDPPNLHDRSAGYGIIRVDKSTRRITFEAWPLHADPEFPQTGSQFPDWPVTINQTDNDGRTPSGFLPVVYSGASENPVVSVYDETSGDLIYSQRVLGNSFRPPVYDTASTYRVELAFGDDPVSQTIANQSGAPEGAAAINRFVALRPSISSGDETLLYWDVSSATTLTIDNGLGDVAGVTINGIGHIAVRPITNTTYTLTLDGDSSARTTVRVFPPRAEWWAANFTPEELLDLLISGDRADPDGDGSDNGEEFRFQTDPRDENSLPRFESIILASGDSFNIDVDGAFPLGSELITPVVEVSPDLVRWTALPANSLIETSREPGSSPGTTRLTYRLLESRPDSPRSFYRAYW
ncbi:MAG: alkaline phosphatase D family protein, partial [Verrucomicrobiales bacterium]